MTQIFNTKFENSMRILLLLYVANESLDLDSIILYDFFSIYGKNYGITDSNLHGDTNMYYSEITSRKKLMQESIKEGVRNGFIYVANTPEGFTYKINDSGVALCKKITADYAQEYISSVKKVLSFTQSMNIKQLKDFAKSIEDKEANNL